jgi:CheY-like chemotaxis protein
VTCPRQRIAFSDIQVPNDPPIGDVIITVTDSGPGLSVEQQQALFHQGVQFNPNQLQAGQGSGLGLWISKEIVSLHHGTILVASDGLGCGSSFKVTIPVVLREDLVLSSRSPCQTPREGGQVKDASPLFAPEGQPIHVNQGSLQFIQPLDPRPESRSRHVLVVDDAASNRKLVCRLLRGKGFVCHEAENGVECVEKVLSGKHPYEFILMDYEMPVMDGPSAARRLRESRCDLLIIGVTGNVLPEDQAYFLEHGANAVLMKPLVVSELFEVIENHEKSPQSKV